ncbi:exopolysaccharide synthesis protein [Salipiger aestuarii]|uniref:Exopolysaccharide synthesis protein ExoD n=1 Tax=Salipiger aestuarii TaxID=568098 RepID=A0A327YBY1_9RHOB|nr:exopolysaccharide biosynthesis protein [Salipiger aestuarii]EIE51359.1 exopolysaccharide synthesis ExoD [Citreicella sp. 357]KAA8608579.1 exopolysaccharide synthesis protein [Salipiger aestuarii]KAA8614171.1 exopolysaccharide synthesis protein [Salipiger aestuarii]KAB2542346.1 exopolysaccharide synthesis protein [Salipiger aestuarii]RAK18334.1 hypothetical protein ATI53_101353 [Salipiger aestuarii]
MTPSEIRPVGDIVDRLDVAVERGALSVGTMIEEFGDSSFLPALMIPALLVVSPLSGIPLFSTACGLMIAFISAQMILARDHLWLPSRMMRLHIDQGHARTALKTLRCISNWLDRNARTRMRMMTSAPARSGLKLLCLLCGAAMPFLELVPFSSSLLGGAVVLMATALLARDGLFALAGSIAVLGAVFIPLTVLGVV